MEVLKKIVAAVVALLVMLVVAPTANAQVAESFVDEHRQEIADCIKEKSPGGLASELIALVPGDQAESAAQRTLLANCVTQIMARNPADTAAGIAGMVSSAFWGDPVGKLASAVLEGNSEAIQMVMTFWTDYRIDKNTMDASVQGVKNIVLSLAGLALIASLIIGGGRIATSRRKGLADGIEETSEVIFTYLVFSLLIPGLIAGALVASDEFSDWVMQRFGAASAEQILGETELTEGVAGPVVMLALAGVSFAGSIMQLVALAIRTLLLPIAAGLAPLFGALSFTQMGKQGLNHLISLIIASILFKPISALLYTATFWFSSGGGDGTMDAFITAVMVGAAGFCAPALVRAVAPAVSQAGGGGAAPVLAGGAAIAGGAMSLAGGVLGKVGGTAVSGGAKTMSGATSSVGGSAAGGSIGGPAGGGPAGGGPTGGGTAGRGGNASQGTTASGATAGRGGNASQGTTASGATAGRGGNASQGTTASGATAGRGGNGSTAATQSTSGRGAARRARSTSGTRNVAAGAQRAGQSAARMGAGAARTGARVAAAAGTTGNRIQSILDDSIGASGTHHGVRR